MGEYLVCLDELNETIGVFISGKVKQKRGKWREGIVRRTQPDVVGFEDGGRNGAISRSCTRKGNRFFPKASREECSSANIFIYTQ